MTTLIVTLTPAMAKQVAKAADALKMKSHEELALTALRLFLRAAAVLLVMAGAASAQTTVKNPTKAIFAPGADAALVTGYELDIINAAGTVVQTMTFPAQTPDGNGEVTLTINVQPVSFGSYTAVVRNVYQSIKSVNSNTSDVWERAPGQPAKPKVQ